MKCLYVYLALLWGSVCLYLFNKKKSLYVFVEESEKKNEAY